VKQVEIFSKQSLFHTQSSLLDLMHGFDRFGIACFHVFARSAVIDRRRHARRTGMEQ